MKKIKLFVAVIVTILVSATTSSSFAQTATRTTFKVAGNCASCKKHIETAARVAGVVTADWNKDTKVFTLVYDPSKVSPDDIQKRIAAVGYDTPKYKGDDKAYSKLDDCCQYDRKQP